MIRLIAAAGVILTVIAVALGRQQARRAESRTMEPPRFQPISDHLFQELRPGVRLLDTQTGALERIRLPGMDRIEYAACSPWRDSQGRTQLIGLWKDLDDGNIRSMGLARYALPECEVLDRVTMETIPGSPLCWYPGLSSRILFAGWDGRLYHFSFEPAGARLSSYGDETLRPRPLVWRIPPMNRGRIMLADPSWPTDSRLGGRVFISVTFVQEVEPDTPRLRTQLWWLRLGSGGSAVEEAGRLVTSEGADTDKPVIEERLPSIATTPDGDLVIAYMVRRAGTLMLQLRLAPVWIDPVTGAPTVHESDAVELVGGRAPSPPMFSPDGRWVFTIPRTDLPPAHATRCSVIDALASRPGTQAHGREDRDGPVQTTAAATR